MTEITFENSNAQKTYNRVLSKTTPDIDKEKVKKIFANHAQLDGKASLSEKEAKEIESALNYRDKLTSFQLGIYNTQEIKQVLNETTAAIEAQKLFNLAFTYNNQNNILTVNPLALSKLKTIINSTAERELEHPKLIEIARRINPDLNPEDHLLIFELENAADPNEKAAVIKKITDRIKSLTEKEIENYDGIVSTSKSAPLKRLNAFWYVLNSTMNGSQEKVDHLLGEYNLEITMQHAETLADFTFLSPSDGGIEKKAELLASIRELLNYKKTNPKLYQKAKEYMLRNKTTLLSLAEDASFALEKAPLGSKAKIDAYRRQRLLYDVALVSGIPNSEIEIRSITSNMPGINLEKELPILAAFAEAEATPEKVDDYIMKDKALEQIRRVSQKLLTIREAYFNKPKPTDQLAFSSTEALLMTYIDFASRFGCSLKQIQEILREEGLLAEAEPHPSLSLQEVNKKGALHIRPQDLPAEVAEILKEAGVYNEICRDLRSIYLTKEIEDPIAKKLVGGASGIANSYTQSIWVDVIDPEEKEVKSFEIAATIIHEWLHVKWGIENFDKHELLRSTPNERNSFLGESQFMQIYLEKLISEHMPEIEEYRSLIKEYEITKNEGLIPGIQSFEQGAIGDIHNLAGMSYFAKAMGLAANIPLRCQANDIAPQTKLPPHSDELDLDTYPTNLNGAHSMPIDKLISSSGLPAKEASQAKKLYESILTDNAYIEGEIYGDENGTLKQRVYLIDKEAKKIQEIDGYFAPLIPLQAYLGLPPDGSFNEEKDYLVIYDTYWNENTIYQTQKESIDKAAEDFEKYLRIALRAAKQEEIPKIISTINDVLYHDYIASVGLRQYLNRNAFLLKDMLIRKLGLSPKLAGIVLNLLNKLAGYKIKMPPYLNLRQIEVPRMILTRTTSNNWKIDQGFMLSLLFSLGSKEVLKESGYPIE